ncbi:MAG: hypothetical protein NVSMB64_06770 [Candidatus Velthaea sp.]
MATVASTSGLPIDSLITSGTPAPPKAQSVTSQLGEDAFLKLLTTQLRNQDPLKPLDDTQSIAQLAQFSAVQSTNSLKASFETFQSNFAVLQSAGLLGTKVTVSTPDGSGNTSTISGSVKSIAVVNGQPQVTLADKNGNIITGKNGNALHFPTSAIVGLGT